MIKRIFLFLTIANWLAVTSFSAEKSVETVYALNKVVMELDNNKNIKNVVFDIGGVLFNYEKEDIRKAFNDPNFNPFKPIDSVHQFVYQLANQKDSSGNKIYKLYILSNWVNKSLNLLKNHYPDFLELFDGIVISDEAGANKPDPRIYEFLIKKYDIKPHESVFIDDQPENMKAAERLGFIINISI